MQQLKLEEKWAKTIAPQDLENIEETFHNCNFTGKNGVFFTFLSEAINHRKDLLVITLIHNCTDESFCLSHETLTYKVNDVAIAHHDFSVPVIIKPHTSMPWTFIFPENTYDATKLIGRGNIDIER